MKKFFLECFKGPITKDQSKDTGMAMVLLLLLLSLAFKQRGYVSVAVIVLVINMIWPQFYRPAAYVWFGLSHLMGTVMSRVLLTIVFFGVVTPIGVFRKLMGKDSMQIKEFHAHHSSVMLVRNHTFVAKDIEKPY